MRKTPALCVTTNGEFFEMFRPSNRAMGRFFGRYEYQCKRYEKAMGAPSLEVFEDVCHVGIFRGMRRLPEFLGAWRSAYRLGPVDFSLPSAHTSSRDADSQTLYTGFKIRSSQKLRNKGADSYRIVF